MKVRAGSSANHFKALAFDISIYLRLLAGTELYGNDDISCLLRFLGDKRKDFGRLTSLFVDSNRQASEIETN